MRRRSSEPGSMDMLLDTMCNTFGGVCFIALMVAILSAATPKASDESETGRETEDRVAARETARLRARRDELRQAVEIHASLATRAATNAVADADLERLSGEVAGSEEKIRLYERKRVEYLDELAKLKTRTAYSRREAARLERLLKELKDKTGRAVFGRRRVVRTPREREVKGLSIINVWLHGRRLYMMDDKRDARWTDTGVEDGKKASTCELVKGGGVLLDDDFFRHGKVWPQLERRFGEKTYVRIFTDTASFDALCLFRDALISRKSLYNWIVEEGTVIHFIEGYDGRVQ